LAIRVKNAFYRFWVKSPITVAGVAIAGDNFHVKSFWISFSKILQLFDKVS
jgi:hypothetical protein